MAINWEYPDELALDLRQKTEGFLELYEKACVGAFVLNGHTYTLPADALAQIRADAITAYGEMNDAVDAIKAHAVT
jgi:hypothetical protein